MDYLSSGRGEPWFLATQFTKNKRIYTLNKYDRLGQNPYKRKIRLLSKKKT